MRQTSRKSIRFLTVLAAFPLAFGLFGGAGMASAATASTGVVVTPDRHCC